MILFSLSKKEARGFLWNIEIIFLAISLLIVAPSYLISFRAWCILSGPIGLERYPLAIFLKALFIISKSIWPLIIIILTSGSFLRKSPIPSIPQLFGIVASDTIISGKTLS